MRTLPKLLCAASLVIAAAQAQEPTFRVDLTSALLCSQAALPALQASTGAIVNTSSLVAIAPAPGAGATTRPKRRSRRSPSTWHSSGVPTGSA